MTLLTFHLTHFTCEFYVNTDLYRLNCKFIRSAHKCMFFKIEKKKMWLQSAVKSIECAFPTDLHFVHHWHFAPIITHLNGQRKETNHRNIYILFIYDFKPNDHILSFVVDCEYQFIGRMPRHSHANESHNYAFQFQCYSYKIRMPKILMIL